MLPINFGIFDLLLEIVSKRCGGTGRASIVFGSTTSGESCCNGQTATPTTFNSSTTTGGNMQPENRVPTHPGEVLREEFLVPLGQTQVALAAHLSVPVQRINELVRGKRGVTPETAWLLSQALDTTPEFWLNLQASHDLAVNKPARKVRRLKHAS
jgi:addiction module HigA family antidote